ncbi:MAG: hydrogenase maturation protease [Nitriliruptoraceae bacterium]
MSATATEPPQRPRAPILVVGVGSPLRGDDAAGRYLVEHLAELELANVATRSVHQLTPELAADWVGRELVVIVDADVEVARPTLRSIERPPVAALMSHHSDPAALYATAALLGEPPERLEVLSLPAADLALGTELSTLAASAVEQAVALLCERLLPAAAAV